jgi:hypothetical protein
MDKTEEISELSFQSYSCKGLQIQEKLPVKLSILDTL